MTTSIRTLTLHDLEILKNIFNFNSFIELGFRNYYLNNIRYKSFGYFENNNLIDVISIIENAYIPAWSISSGFSKTKLYYENLVSHIIDFEEGKHRYQFFTLSETLDCRILDHRYKKYLEHVVEPNTYTGFENIDHDILEYQKFNQIMYIHLWVLKNEYRTF